MKKVADIDQPRKKHDSWSDKSDVERSLERGP